MDNHSSRPLVAPSEYERNRAAISSYRTYIDMYEKLNEQGLRNHEELGRLEQALQQKIRAGEEAKQQLEFLRQSSARYRLTDGRVAVPDLVPMASSVPPVTFPAGHPPSSSAYIEEVPHHEQKTPSNLSYSPYSAHPTNIPHAPQPSYVNQQRQPNSYAMTDTPVQYNQQTQQKVPTPPQHVQPSMQARMPNMSRPSQQALTQAPTRAMQATALTQAQLENYRLLQHNKDHLRQTTTASQPNVRNAAFNPHYPFIPHFQNSPHPASTPSQQMPGNQAQVNGQRRQGGTQSFTGAGSFRVAEWQSAQKSVPTVTSPAPAAMTNSATSVASALDGALVQVPSNNAQTSAPVPPLSGNTTVQPPAPATASFTVGVTGDSSMNSSHPSMQTKAPSPAPPIDITSQLSSSAAAVLHSPPASPSGVGAPNLAGSPMRTPRQADKTHLARDLLRALKRPRTDVSSTIKEPEPKRHAPDLAAKLTAQATWVPSYAPSATQPPASTSGVSTLFSATPLTPTVVPTAPPSSTRSAAQPLSTPVTHPIFPPRRATPSAPAQANTPLSQLGDSALSTLIRAQIQQGAGMSQPKTDHTHISIEPDRLQGEKPTKKEGPVAGTAQSPQIVKPPGVPTSGPPAANRENVQVSTPIVTTLPPLPSAMPSSASTSNAVTNADASGSTDIPVEIPEAPVTNGMRRPNTVIPSMIRSPTEKDPLFLPSPTSSLILEPVIPAIDLLALSPAGKDKEEAKVSDFETLPTLKPQKTETTSASNMVFAHVLVPPLPEYAKRWKARQRRSARADELDMIDRDAGDSELLGGSRSPSLGDYAGPSTSRSSSASAAPVEVVDIVEGENDSEEAGQGGVHFSSYDITEQQALHEHCSILRESFCRWLDCDVALNTPGALLRHLDFEHGPRRINAELPWTCQWAGCGYTVISRDDYRQHIEKHAVFPLWCPFRKCTENFRTPRQLIRHKRSDHDSNAVLRRTAQPSIVSSRLIALMPKVPKILPAYMTEYRLVRPAPITRQRHEIIMPSVLRRISGNVPAQLQRYNAARPMPMTPSGKNAEPPINTPYSFLEHRSTRYSSYLSTPARTRNIKSLGSGYVTNLAKRGLVLWPDKESDEALPMAMMEELEELEEDAVEKELLDGEGCDVFGPTIAIETSGVGGGNGVDGSGASGTPPAKADPDGKEGGGELMDVPRS